jgi:hypothetical protein
MDTIPEFVTLVQGREMATWLNELEKLCAQRFEENYRGIGVRQFYATKLTARMEHVREIRRRFETELFEEWKNGVRSMHDLSRLLNALISALNERLNTIDSRITRAKENENLAARKVTANREEWAKAGPIGLRFRGRGWLNAQGECLRDLYISRTQGEAWSFAKRLLQDLITEITRLGTDVHNCASLVDDGIKEFTERIAQRCNDEKMDLQQAVVRFYKPEKVREFASDLDKDQTEQVRQAQGVRLALIEQLGENPGFATFQARLTKQRFFDVLEQKCEVSAIAAHDQLITLNRDRSPLFGVNIVGALEREFSGNEDGLRKFVHDLVTMAGNYLDFESGEVNRVAPGIPTGVPTRVSQMMVIMPAAQEYGRFAEDLKNLFLQQLSGTIPAQILESDAKPHEITLIGLMNLFPLRYIKPLRFLKERYDARLRQTDKPDRVQLELHCEGDGTQFPDLFVTIGLTRSLPYIMLAKTLGLIQPLTNPTTGSTDLYLIELDEFGLEKRVRLGKNLADVFDTVDITTAQKFEDTVGKLLAQPENRHKDKRATLMAQLRDELKLVLSDRGGNFEDEIYKRFEEAARQAIQLLQAES